MLTSPRFFFKEANLFVPQTQITPSRLPLLKKSPCVEECLGDQDASVLRERIEIHEHRWIKCIYVMGGL